MGVYLTVIRDDESFQMDAAAFKKLTDFFIIQLFGRHTVISNQRESEHQNLIFKRRVGKTLRIAHHSGRKHHFAFAFLVGAKGSARDLSAVLESEGEFFHRVIVRNVREPCGILKFYCCSSPSTESKTASRRELCTKANSSSV